jgi:signal peptidase II
VSPFRLGLGTAIATLVLDQGNKLWLIDVFDIAARQPVRLLPWFDVVYAKNPGISYSLFSATTAAGRWGLFGVALAATALLCVWLWRARTYRTALALGLIVGGALGNAGDRFAYGSVADFYHFHVGGFSWYIFNLADVAIVAGVAILLFDSFRAPAPAAGEIGRVEEGRP